TTRSRTCGNIPIRASGAFVPREKFSARLKPITGTARSEVFSMQRWSGLTPSRFLFLDRRRFLTTDYTDHTDEGAVAPNRSAFIRVIRGQKKICPSTSSAIVR